MQTGVQLEYRRAGNVMKNNAGNANSDAYITNQTMTFARSKYLEIVLTTIFVTNFSLLSW